MVLALKFLIYGWSVKIFKLIIDYSSGRFIVSNIFSSKKILPFCPFSLNVEQAKKVKMMWLHSDAHVTLDFIVHLIYSEWRR